MVFLFWRNVDSTCQVRKKCLVKKRGNTTNKITICRPVSLLINLLRRRLRGTSMKSIALLLKHSTRSFFPNRVMVLLVLILALWNQLGRRGRTDLTKIMFKQMLDLIRLSSSKRVFKTSRSSQHPWVVRFRRIVEANLTIMIIRRFRNCRSHDSLKTDREPKPFWSACRRWMS